MNTRLVAVIAIGLILTFMPVVGFAQTVDASNTNIPSVAQPIQSNNGGQLTISGAIVLVIDWLKRNNKFAWLTEDTERRNRIVAVIASAVGAAAVHWTFDKEAGRLVIDGLTVAGITTGLTAWAKSYIYQQLIFKMSRT